MNYYTEEDIRDYLKSRGYADFRVDEIVGQIPSTADVRENVHGEWILHPERKNIYGGKCIECPNCGTMYMVQYIEDEKFCRNCGAVMRKA